MRCALSQYRHYPRCVVAATTLCLTGLIVSDASASSTALTAPQPFEAKYRLSVSGWPSATITHHLSKADSHWRSDMRFSIAVVSGEERSRFSVADDSTRALLYNSRYSLFGIGNDYQLRESELTTLDRQTALFDLSAARARKTAAKRRLAIFASSTTKGKRNTTSIMWIAKHRSVFLPVSLTH